LILKNLARMAGAKTTVMTRWNDGIMECWANCRILVDDKLKNGSILLKTNLPKIHYYIIPYERQVFKPQKMFQILIRL